MYQMVAHEIFVLKSSKIIMVNTLGHGYNLIAYCKAIDTAQKSAWGIQTLKV
jgi:hypothetical protein